MDDQSIARELARIAGAIRALDEERRRLIGLYAAEQMAGDEYITANRALDRDLERLTREKAKLEQMLGLDQPFYRQYVSYLGKALHGDLGVSMWTKEPVLDEILRRLPVSLELAVLAMFFGLVIALPTGIFSAVRQDTWLDYLFRSGAIGGR